MNNILFRADSSSLIGTGHIMRDLVLAKEFQESKIVFACQELEGNLIEKIPYQVERLKSNETFELDSLIKKLSIDMLVIDHYEINYEFEKELKLQNPELKIFVLDDTYEKHYCDVLLNHNIYANANRYEGLIPKESELRCGSEYTLLRDEFYKEKESKREKIYDIFIAIGGADNANLNPQILELLPSHLKVVLLTTTANKHLDSLKKFIAKKKNISLEINTNQVAKLMHESGLAIVTPSVTLNEVYFMGLEFIAIQTAKNQAEMYQFLQRNNFLALQKFDKADLKHLLGLKIKSIQATLLNFTEMTLMQKKMVLEWRNHPKIKQWMYNQDDIRLQMHLEYIEKLQEVEDKKYFLVKKEDSFIGVIDFTDIDKEQFSTEFGLYVNPFEKMKGLGRFLLELAIKYASDILQLQRVKLEVFAENKRAIALYKEYNFQETQRKVVNNKEVICMEYNNENR